MLHFPALFCLVAASLPTAESFKQHTIATGLRGGYQVVATDVNADGKTDLIALASGMPDLYWFEAPKWEKHVLARNLPRMINLAAADVDGDRIPEILLAYEFANEAARSIGIVALLTHDGDPKKPWKIREIDRLTTSHRLRTAKINGETIFINAPLTGANAKAPDYRDHVPLVLYRPGIWKREVIGAADEGVVHGLWVGKWKKSDKSDSILTSSFQGIYRYSWEKGRWKRTKLSPGDPAPWPKSGSSEISPSKEGWFASLEPWHGNQVVIYDKGKRNVIDTQLVDGHVLLTADVNGDGKTEVLAGYRGTGRSVYLYSRSGRKKTWQRDIIDNGGISAAGCAIADLNSDGKPDIACIGSATANLKWYENLGRNSNPRGR
ncbi:hypothetical protein F183_A42320 [Bryobacterales bacterium F-183]|nr:hypothetical protein F183_A42320 [Bryobacterales bacterium F-183]